MSISSAVKIVSTIVTEREGIIHVRVGRHGTTKRGVLRGGIIRPTATQG